MVVQVGSNSGFQTGERCRPQSRFIDCVFFLMYMASIVLRFQYPVAVAWTFAASQSMACWDLCTCTAILFLHWISILYNILMFCHSLHHGPSCLSNVCELAVTAGHCIDNVSLLLHWRPLLHLHQLAPQCLLGSENGLHPLRCTYFLQLLAHSSNIRQEHWLG